MEYIQISRCRGCDYLNTLLGMGGVMEWRGGRGVVCARCVKEESGAESVSGPARNREFLQSIVIFFFFLMDIHALLFGIFLIFS